jgi:hypothetical protein
LDDTLKVSTALDLSTAGTVLLADFGLEFVVLGTPAYVTGDGVTFEVRPINTESMDVIIGATTDTFKEFGAWVVAAENSDGSLVELDCFRCLAAGVPINFNEKEYSTWETTAKILYSSAKNGVFSMRRINT